MRGRSRYKKQSLTIMPSPEKYSILLAEPDPAVAALWLKMIKRPSVSQLSVKHTAKTLDESLKILEGGAIDLLLLDPDLSDSKGGDALKRIRELFPDLPIVVLSGIDDDAAVSKILEGGAQDCLIKGRFDARTLIHSILSSIRLARAESSMARERDMFQMLLDNIPERIYFKDRQSRFVRVSKSLAWLFKQDDPQELVGKTDFNFFTLEHAQPAFHDEQEILTTGEAIVGKTEKETLADGSVEWSLTTKMPWVDQQGKIIGTFGISRDVTEIKTMDAALSAERHLIRSVIDNVPDRILLKDVKGRYMLVNSAHAKLLGLDDPSQALGKKLGDFLPATVVEQHTAEDEEILRSGMPMISHEELMENALGEKMWLSTTKVPLRDQEGKIVGIVVISRDISEQKKAREEVIEANRSLTEAVARLKKAHEEMHAIQLQLIEAEKMKSIGRLAAGVAHEVKNPLAIIDMGVTYLLQKPSSQDDETPQVLKEMGEAVKRADIVIKGLLDFSTPKKLDVQEEDLNTIIEQSLLLVRGEMKGSSYRVVKELHTDLPRLKVDRLKIGQVFVNLLTNAIHAMPEGGTLTVRTSTRQHAGVGENIGDSRTESFRIGRTLVVAEVEDEGTGIPSDKLSKLFDPFFTTKTTGQGTGLGLSVSKSIIDLHGGTIEIKNRPEGGAKATITLEV